MHVNNGGTQVGLLRNHEGFLHIDKELEKIVTPNKVRILQVKQGKWYAQQATNLNPLRH